MCGIVGYVGEKQAQDVVIEGLRRLEYRGYDSAGVALVERRRDRVGQEGRQAREPREGARRVAPAARRRPASGTPAGPRTAPRTTPTRTRTSATRGRVALVHNGIIENFAELRGEVEAAGRRPPLGDRHRDRRPPGRDRPGRRAARSPTRCARSAPGSRGRSRWWRSTPRTRRGWWRRDAARRWSSGSARARTSSAATSRRSSSTRGRRSSSGRTRSSRSRATRSRSWASTAQPAEGRRYHVDWDLSAAEKDGYDWFMRKEIFEQPRAIADALLGPSRRRRTAAARRGPHLRRRAARGRQDHRDRLPARRSTPGWWRSTPSSTGAGCRSRSS